MKRSYSNEMVFVDLSFNVLLGFVILFALAFLSMQQKQQQDAKVQSKAEFVITVEWPHNHNDDVDSYMEDPVGNICFFRAREEGLMHLDRDDLGWSNDTIVLADGTRYQVNENKEILTIRGIIPGEYVVNAHMFGKRIPEVTEVTIKLEKLNPQVKTLAIKKVKLYQSGEEQTAFRFTLNPRGDVIELKTDMPKPIAAKSLGFNTSTGQPYNYEEEPNEDGSNGEHND